uniref:FAD-binding domain-containing protein n=1 Tax=Streptomyces sp. WT6 TaxID=1486372 RepID=A0A023PZR1_9ACTN|nr:hypothetical protein Wt4.39c [Streptomyces sp. WT6]
MGSGPAGSTAALALASLGIPHLVITKHRHTANSPRAHIINQRTLDVLRDLGIDEEVHAKGVPLSTVCDAVYCTSLSGAELGRVRTWGSHPDHVADYLTAGRTHGVDLPQHLLEPLLLSRAAALGSHVRFDCAYTGLIQKSDGVEVQALDRLSGTPLNIRARYVIGADGARSRVAEDIGLPYEGHMNLAGSISIVFHADLTRLVAHRPGVLYWVLRPGADIGGIGLGLVRMVRPWNEWLAVWGYDITQTPPRLDDETARGLVHDLLGDDTIPVTIRSTASWGNNAQYATRYRNGRVFCAGDAVHRHPPSNGLGANTAIQDAFNLAWKLAYVVRGQAGEELLDTYDAERVPVGQQVTRRANQSIEETSLVFQALGLQGSLTQAEFDARIAAWRSSGPDGLAARRELRAALRLKEYEFAAHGVEMGQVYRSTAVLGDHTPPPKPSRDPELFPQPTTWPGARLPHAWLTDRQGCRVGIHDLTGHGGFTLLTGVAGDPWVEAGATVADRLGIDLTTHIIGPGQNYQDSYGDWAERNEIPEAGCVLVRPDGHVGWRCHTLPDTPQADLELALTSILHRPARRSGQA